MFFIIILSYRLNLSLQNKYFEKYIFWVLNISNSNDQKQYTLIFLSAIILLNKIKKIENKIDISKKYMQKTQSGKKVFLSKSKPRPSTNLVKSLQKFHLKKITTHPQSASPVKPDSGQVDDGLMLNLHKVPKRNPNFKYYFYDKLSSTKRLNQLRNSQSVKDLLLREKDRARQLQNEINQKQRRILSNEHLLTNDTPFYKKYKPQPVQNDPYLLNHCIPFPNNKLRHSKSPQRYQKIRQSSKIRQNKLNLYKYRGTKGMISPYKFKTQGDSQSISLHEENASPIYNRGLSPFEFKNTIEGISATKSSRNIRMDLDKTKKIDNVNKIWYNTRQDHQIFKKMRNSVEQQQKLKKCHSFDNYNGHKLFQSKINRKKQPAEDKFYDYNGQAKEMQFYQKWKTQNHLKMEKMRSRPQLPKKLGTNLDYDIPQGILSPSKSKKRIMGVSSSQRKLIFSPQVISPARGCYR